MTDGHDTTDKSQDEASVLEEETYQLEPARVYLAGINIPKEPDEEPPADR